MVTSVGNRQEVSTTEFSSVQVLGHKLVGHSIGNGMAHRQAGDAAVLQPTQPSDHTAIITKQKSGYFYSSTPVVSNSTL